LEVGIALETLDVSILTLDTPFIKLASGKTIKNLIRKNGFSDLFIEIGGNLD